MKELTFQEFCDRIASEDNTIGCEDAVKLPIIIPIHPSMKPIADSIIREFKNKTKRFGSMKLDWVTEAIEKYSHEELGEELRRRTNDDEVSNDLIQYLSFGLFKTQYNDLSQSEKNIIKVFAIYIILQI